MTSHTLSDQLSWDGEHSASSSRCRCPRDYVSILQDATARVGCNGHCHFPCIRLVYVLKCVLSMLR